MCVDPDRRCGCSCISCMTRASGSGSCRPCLWVGTTTSKAVARQNVLEISAASSSKSCGPLPASGCLLGARVPKVVVAIRSIAVTHHPSEASARERARCARCTLSPLRGPLIITPHFQAHLVERIWSPRTVGVAILSAAARRAPRAHAAAIVSHHTKHTHTRHTHAPRAARAAHTVQAAARRLGASAPSWRYSL